MENNTTLIQKRQDICRYVGENPNLFKTLCEDKGLPVWRTNPNGTWKARPKDLDLWIDIQAEKELKAVGLWKE